MPITTNITTLLLAATVLAFCFLLFLRYRSRHLLLKNNAAAAAHHINQQENELQLLRHQLSELKLSGLKSQVNPHFAFNCLNGIYTALMTGETSLAQEYISGFAILLRKMLLLTDKNFISLQEETDMLDQYLRLEQLRTNNGFVYTLKTDSRISPATLPVPCMLVQPFVENAIWHGLMHKANDRQLHIRWIQLQQNLYACEVTDNGIGRAQALQYHHDGLKTNNHHSRGMEICIERASLYRSLYHTRFDIEITDLPGEENTVRGTRVYITFEVVPAMTTPH
ncbi:histidine kinase [Chitinophaga polysaccharea]|uniref:Histidine kinase n=1 Tax=Chitinophaga polysaccharea TaxID=1293035 RepID=A0A561Q311_9BACT|nr:histidine kinase [Chitinophaga polysaccharea]TWF44757.1 histidine kinase [Chitinophaga polysaccharea]